MALAFAGQDKLLWEVFRWVGLIFGGMLGIFLLAVTTRRRGWDRFNPVAMLSSVVLLIGLEAYQSHTNVVHIAWPWYVVLGTVWTYLFAAYATPPIQRYIGSVRTDKGVVTRPTG